MDGCPLATALCLNCKKPPLIGNALQGVNASVRETKARTRNQILHSAREKDFARFGMSGHSRTDVHGNSPDLVALHLTLARVDSAAEGQPQGSDRIPHGAGATYRPRRTVEAGEDSIACNVDHSPSQPRHCPADLLVIIA